VTGQPMTEMYGRMVERTISLPADEARLLQENAWALYDWPTCAACDASPGLRSLFGELLCRGCGNWAAGHLLRFRPLRRYTEASA
jgi:hypothetical protein